MATVTIKTIAEKIGKEEVETTLPNGRVVKGINWSPSDLPSVFKTVEGMRDPSDAVTIDGAAPIWMMICVAHAAHPSSVGINYPQGGCVLPVSGAPVKTDASNKEISISVEEGEMVTTVTISLNGEAIDAVKAAQELEVPYVPHGKPIIITGRAPAALYAGISEALAHTVPAVAVFQPGTGNVVAVSHSKEWALGDIIEA